MGFPMWTLWGMGLSALGVLLLTTLAFIAQSPHFLSRAHLTRFRLDLRARTFSGYALALILLAGGFFLAGVPLEPLAERAPLMTPSPLMTAVSDTAALNQPSATQTAVPASQEPVQTPQSGAFSGPPPTAESGAPDAPADESATAPATRAPTATATPSPTPSPTITPTPTLTPTPIDGETAVINTGTSTLWVQRMPGGRQLVLVSGGDTVILMPGHANQGGILWQEVMTLDGAVGWVQERFLSTDLE